MSLRYNILWVEDTDESYGTYSRRIGKYAESKHIICNIDRIKTADEFNVDKFDFEKYDLLVVDYHLGERYAGHEIIVAVRSGKHLHDVLFYSATPESELFSLLTKHHLEGVYVSDREHDILVPKVQSLIDKAIKRTIRPINIRGLVMDTTSEFDNIVKDTILMSWNLLNDDEKVAIMKYVEALAEKSAGNAKEFAKRIKDLSLSDVLAEHSFTAMMSIKLLDKIIKTENPNFVSAKSEATTHLESDKLTKAYDDDILRFRNMLAHAKIDGDVEGPILIGSVNNEKHYCDEVFCSMMRKSLIKYQAFFVALYHSIEEV